jgi:hypothetical protein
MNKTKLFDSTIAQAQRGEPEFAMIKVQRALGGGILNPVVENVGDLTHRMTEDVTAKSAGYEFVRPKVERSLRYLKEPYGFEKEYQGNIEANAPFYHMTKKEYTDKLDKALEQYAEAHRKLGHQYSNINKRETTKEKEDTKLEILELNRRNLYTLKIRESILSRHWIKKLSKGNNEKAESILKELEVCKIR